MVLTALFVSVVIVAVHQSHHPLDKLVESDSIITTAGLFAQVEQFQKLLNMIVLGDRSTPVGKI